MESFRTIETVTKVAYKDGKFEETEASGFCVAEEPFSHGSLRAAFWAYWRDSPEQRLVAKRFLSAPGEGSSQEEEEAYLLDVRLQSVAHEMGVRFNRYSPPKSVLFIEAFLVRADGHTYAVEPALKEGTFVKFNNNTGFVAPDARNTPHAFSHFSWEASSRQWLISDVQGVGDMYTDPGIQSLDRRFGNLDLGPTGVAFFFSSHRCNPICSALGLKQFELCESKHSSDAVTVEHIGLRRGKTRPVLTKCLTVKAGDISKARALPSIVSPRGASDALKSEHSLVDILAEVPLEPEAEAAIHLALGVLHEQGRLAALFDELKACVDGEAVVADSGKPPDLEAALFHYQKAALKGNVEAQMICASIFSGFQPRDHLPEIDVLDQKRALYYLELAAQRKSRSATLHLADMKCAQEKWADAVALYEQANSLPPLSEERPDESLPHNVWCNSLTRIALYARAAECFERLEKWADAAEWYGSASEEAFCDPLRAKEAMKYQELQAKCEGKC